MQALGYTREKTPAGSTFQEVFKALDVEVFTRGYPSHDPIEHPAGLTGS